MHLAGSSSFFNSCRHLHRSLQTLEGTTFLPIQFWPWRWRCCIQRDVLRAPEDVLIQEKDLGVEISSASFSPDQSQDARCSGEGIFNPLSVSHRPRGSILHQLQCSYLVLGRASLERPRWKAPTGLKCSVEAWNGRCGWPGKEDNNEGRKPEPETNRQC